MNELVTNAVKYAFPDDRPGSIRVCFEQRKDQLFLMVADNGVAIRGPCRGSGMGQQLIQALCQQLAGCLHSESTDRGTLVQIAFPSANRARREAVRDAAIVEPH